MTCEELSAWRKRAGLTQAELGKRIGGYTALIGALESGALRLGEPFIARLERASLTLAVERGKPDLALASIATDAAAFMAIFRGDAP